MSIELHLDRWFPASTERVFEALTDIDQLRDWYTCDPDSAWIFHTWDATPGGRLSVRIEGTQHAVDVTGEFVEVTPPSRLTYTWNDEYVELDLAPENDGTRLRLLHSQLDGPPDREIRRGGWTHNLESLHTHCAP